MNLLLDTNILIHLSRNPKRTLLNKIANPSNRKIYISIVTFGELKSIAIQNIWGEARWKRIGDILQEATFIEISENLLETYAQIDSFHKEKILFLKNFCLIHPAIWAKMICGLLQPQHCSALRL